jgi:hypothetical protein
MLVSMVDYNQELPYWNERMMPRLEQAELRNPRAQARIRPDEGAAQLSQMQALIEEHGDIPGRLWMGRGSPMWGRQARFAARLGL